MIEDIRLREVEDGDIHVFFEQQLDPVATQMAGFPSRGEDEFHSHWRRVRSNENNILRTILFKGKVSGNIVSWEQDGKRQIGYWIGRKFWGKGIASQALAQFLVVVKARPLYAYVAKHNTASIRVLEKNGFTISVEDSQFDSTNNEKIEEVLFQLI